MKDYVEKQWFIMYNKNRNFYHTRTICCYAFVMLEVIILKENIVIRRLENKDIKNAAILLKETYAMAPWNEDWTIEVAEERMKELFSCPMAICYVSEEENQINGVMCGRKITYWSGKEYFVDEFFISPAYQGKGLGSSMLEFVRQDLSKHEIASIVLNTGKGFPSEKFYLKNGFIQKESLIFMYNDFAI